ncbi:MAG TPA: hypothetical protein VFI02_01665, partial [Armatimonadota bacterium]|nr:hypothetical protein [Armatimonadota bacterium]
LAASPFIREGYSGDSSHLIANGAALAWVKAARKYGITTPIVFISAGYAPVTAEQYLELAPYADLFEIHFSNGGWFHKNEIMLRLAEFNAARAAGLPVAIRLITNKDNIGELEMPNAKFLDQQMKKLKLKEYEVLETPYHDDEIRLRKSGQHRSEPTGDHKYICCETGKCKTCLVQCLSTIGQRKANAPDVDTAPLQTTYEVKGRAGEVAPTRQLRGAPTPGAEGEVTRQLRPLTPKPGATSIEKAAKTGEEFAAWLQTDGKGYAKAGGAWGHNLLVKDLLWDGLSRGHVTLALEHDSYSGLSTSGSSGTPTAGPGNALMIRTAGPLTTEQRTAIASVIKALPETLSSVIIDLQDIETRNAADAWQFYSPGRDTLTAVNQWISDRLLALQTLRAENATRQLREGDSGLIIPEDIHEGRVPFQPAAKKSYGMTAEEMKMFGRDVAGMVRWAQIHQQHLGYKQGVADTAETGRRALREKLATTKEKAGEKLSATKEAAGEKLAATKETAREKLRATKEGARETLNALRMKTKFYMRNRIDLANIVLAVVPREYAGRYLLRVAQAQTPKDMERVLDAVSKWLTDADNRAARREFTAFIKKAAKAYKDGKTRFGSMRIEVRKAFEDILDVFDLAKLSDKKALELLARSDYLHRIAGDVDTIFAELQKDAEAGALEDVKNWHAMGAHRREEVQRLQKKPIRDLSADDIREMQRKLEHLLDMQDTKGAINTQRRNEMFDTGTVEMRDEVAPAIRVGIEGVGAVQLATWMLSPGAATLHTLARRVTGANTAMTEKILYHDIRMARLRSDTLVVEFLHAFREKAKAAGISNADLEMLNKEVTVTLGGRTFDVTYGELLSVWAHMNADGGNLDALLSTQGLRFELYHDKMPEVMVRGKRVTPRGVWMSKKTIVTGTPTAAELREVARLVPDRLKKFVDVHFEVNREHQAKAINNTSLRWENYEKAIYDKYFHIWRWFPKKASGRTLTGSTPGESKGRYMSRVGGTNHIRIAPFMVEVIDGMQADSVYGSASTGFGDMSFAETIEMARSLTANPIWQQKIRDAGGETQLTEIMNLLDVIQGQVSNSSVLDQISGAMLANFSRSILGGKASTSLIQISSLVAARKFIGAKYFVDNIADVGQIRKDLKHLEETVPTLWLRWKAKHFSFAAGAVAAQQAFSNLIFDKTPVLDYSLQPMTWGDQVAIWSIWKAAGRQVAAEQGLTPGTAEHEQATVDLLMQAMETQPQFNPETRTHLTSIKQPFIKASFMFMSARSAQLQSLLQANDDLRQGRITKEQWASEYANIIVAAWGVSLARRVARILVKTAGIAGLAALGLHDEPEEEFKEQFVKEVSKIPRETVENFIGLSVVGIWFSNAERLIEARIRYGPVEYSDLRTNNLFIDVGLDATKGLELWTRAVLAEVDGDEDAAWYYVKQAADQSAALISMRFGIPYSGIKADYVWPLKAVVDD